MRATRLPDQAVGALPPYDEASLCYWKDESGRWYLNLPGAGLGDLSKHDVVEQLDGTITVSPSILIGGHLGSRHGFLERGIWRDA